MLKKLQNYINHIVFVIDASGSISISGLTASVVKVVDSQIAYLAKRSQELDQETRVSIYTFNEAVECLIYDKDVLRLPSIASFYSPDGGTALIDASLVAIEDLGLTSQKYGDHAFLLYVVTDGQENRSSNSSFTLAKKIGSLPENWTLGVLVPDQTGVHEAKKFGFPVNNIQVWDTTVKGVKEVGETIRRTTEAYLVNRSSGIRGTKNLFQLDANALKYINVKNVLSELNTSDYQLLPVRSESVIKDFVESWTRKDYRVGSAYYQLTKPEKIQAYKQICIQNKRNGKVYSGVTARGVLGLPDYEVKVSPADFGEFDIFVQSSSVNRKLVNGTKLIVLN